MGRLTDGMTRLHGEIVALRHSREGFVRGVRDDVSAMRADFRSAHAEMAQEARTGRQAFVSHMRETVAGLREGFASDLIGARQAWFGRSRVTRGPREGEAKPARRSSRRPG